MNFYIKKNATLPLLKMQVVKDGRSAKIVAKPAYIVELLNLDVNALPEYYVYFKFTERDTNQVGQYSGEFLIRNDQGDLVLPLREELNIYIQESFIIKSPCC